ncbi:MAG: response regulator [Erythrobacter sp.]
MKRQKGQPIGLTMAHILIADDDEIAAQIASEALIDAGHACGWVTSGEDAWAFLHHRQPDVMLLDQIMPGMSGLTLLRKIRLSETLYDLPVIMFTTKTGAPDEEQAIFAGAQDYIRKPFDPHSLNYRIHRLIQKRGWRHRHKDLQTHLAESSGDERSPNSAVRRAV